MANAVNLAVLSTIFSTAQVSAYYCDNDKCGVDEYCCGNNICCTSYAVWQMWYFWCGIVLFVMLLTAFSFFCRYRYYHTTILVHASPNYSRLDDIHVPLLTENSSDQYKKVPVSLGPPTHPPAYSQASHGEKDPTYMR